MRTITLIRSFLIITAVLATSAIGQKTWTGGAGDGNWDTAGNWNPAGVPGKTDDVVIPGNSGTIKVDPVTKKIKSLTLQPSTNPCGTILDSTVPGGVVFIICLNGDAAVNNNKIKAGDGNNKQEGGRCTLQVSGTVTVTPGGEIRGGNGGSGDSPRTGGKVTVTGGTVNNGGKIKGGNGGNFTNGATMGPCNETGGRNGGEADVKSQNGGTQGTIEGGDGGTTNFPGGNPGKPGGAKWKGKYIQWSVGEKMQGKKISMKVPDNLDLSGASAGSFVATHGPIRIDATGFDIDLTGIPAGTDVFQSTATVFIGNLLLDPGVNIEDLCTGSVFVGMCSDDVSIFLMGSEAFTTGNLNNPPGGWNSQLVQGFAPVEFDNPGGIPLDPSWTDCKSAVFDASLDGPAQNQMILDSPTFSTVGINDPILLQWDQWHQPSVNSNIEVFVSDGQNVTPVFFDNQGTPPADHPVIDITSLVQNTEDAFIRFQYTAVDQSFWVVDNVEVRVVTPSLGGQAPQAGSAVLDVNGSKNINGEPVPSNQDGPYFADAEAGGPLHFHFEGQPNEIIYFVSGTVVPQQLSFAGLGSLDLANAFVLISGSGQDPLSQLFRTNQFGYQDMLFTVPTTMAGQTLGFQAILTSPSIISFSNAVEVTVN